MTSIDKHPSFVVHQHTPFNGGPALDWLRRSFLTPAEHFYVRSHGTLPEVDAGAYALSVGGLVAQPLTLSLDDLRERFPRQRVVATLQCAGNRRDELMAVAPIPHEVPWGAEAIGNAVWGGARLRDVLRAVGVQPGATYVAFDGLDAVERDGRPVGFGSSIPLAKAMRREVLLAYEMNDRPLAPVHGFPLRVVVPGYIGARSVKWLAGLRVQREPSDNYFQSHGYHLYPPHMRPEAVDEAAGLALSETPVNAVICRPCAGEQRAAGALLVQGYAVTSGGRRVARVDVSADGGATWVQARQVSPECVWAWCLWEARVALAPGVHELVVRACDTATNTQPQEPASIWNFKGYMNNAWHRVSVRVNG